MAQSNAGISSVGAATKILQKYKQGFKLRHPSEPRLNRLGRPPSQLDTIKETLMDKIYEHRFMTLAQRAAWIKSEKGIDVFRTTLAKWYRR